MSLCYDEIQKWIIISLALVVTSLAIGLVLWSMLVSMEYAYGQSNSDFYLEANVKESPVVEGAHNLDIIKFEMQGEKYKEICPSLQCKIDYGEKLITFSPPDIPSTLISSWVGFRLHDDLTNADLGSKKKELVEQFNTYIYCSVYDIVEENGQEVYYCHSENHLPSYIANLFDGRSWIMNITGIYDAKNEFFKVSGNFTGKG